MRQLYLLSKPFDNRPRLIGVLSELAEGVGEKEGEYQFEYKLGGTFPEFFLVVDEFPDPKKVYRGAEARPFVNRIVPKRNSRYIKGFLEEVNLTEYNEWAFLKYCGRKIIEDETFLSESIPEEAILYENLETA